MLSVQNAPHVECSTWTLVVDFYFEGKFLKHSLYLYFDLGEALCHSYHLLDYYYHHEIK